MKEIPKVHLTNSLSHYFHFLFKDLRYLLNMIDGHVELQTIHVDNASESIRCECWKHNVANQFPIKSINNSNGNLVVEVGSPHEGYIIRTTLLNSKLNGKSYIVSNDNVIIAQLYFENGIASGPCILYDELGLLFYTGYLENGYRQGRGVEYDEDGNVTIEGFYDKGKKRSNLVQMKKKRGYWEEFDESGNLMNRSQRDEYGRMDGICYVYNSKKEISRISEWKEGEELEILKEFKNNVMIEYTNGIRCYEGGYNNSLRLEYRPNGVGKEYGCDGQTLIYYGHFINGVRYGQGIEYRNMRIYYNGHWINGYKAWTRWIPPCGLIILLVLYVIVIVVCSSGIIRTSLEFMLVLICYCPCIYGLLSIPFSIIRCSLFGCCAREVPSDNNSKKSQPSSHWDYVNRNVLKYEISQTRNSIIEIEDNRLTQVKEFRVDHSNNLKQIIIGKNLFSQKKNRCTNDESKSFHILNCDLLESIQIGERSFSDFSRGFELKNLPQLQTIQIGAIGSWSCNFNYSSFVIRGIELILNI